MNFYSLTLDIHDRREHQLELYPVGAMHRLQKPKRFVLDVPNFNQFKVVTLPLQSLVKCFVANESDINLSNYDTQATRVGHSITIELTPKVLHNKAFEENNIQQNKNIKDDIDDISFDEIESHIAYETQPQPKPNSVNQELLPKYERTDLGSINDTIGLQLVVNDYAIKLEAILIQELGEIPFNNNNIEISIILNSNGVAYTNTIQVTLSHPAEFLGIALDFGSESSQMAIKRYEPYIPFNEEAPDTENLFKNIVAYHKSKGWIARNDTYDYYQEEKGTSFYKSHFFLKKILSGDYTDIDKELFVIDPEDNLKMLTEIFTAGDQPTYKLNAYQQLPNLKILHKHERVLEQYDFEIEKDGYPIYLKLREMKQKVYNTILETMIASFLKKEFIRYNGAKRNIRMMLLIPNNYDTKDINKTQAQLNIIFEKLSHQEDFKGRILSWEILTISESDASFIGYINKNNVNIENNKDYIIIDSGKGTTDFSIIRTGEQNIYNLNAIYRNGFTGAGNMITYAVFETLIAFIREQTSQPGDDIQFIKEKIINVLKSDNLAFRNNFYQEIERLKFNYVDVSQKDNIKQHWNRAADGDITFSSLTSIPGVQIDALNNILSKIYQLTDFYGYIQDACDFIANNVVSYLKIIQQNKTDLDIKGVILTGRAFKFDLLANTIKRKIQQELKVPIDKIHLLSGNELKDICIKGVFNNAIKLNAEVTGYPIQLVYKSKADLPASTIKDVKKTDKKIGKRIFNFFINDLADLEKVEEIVSIEDKVNFESLQRSQFLIGCKKYTIRNEEFFINNTGVPITASIDFTQRGFVMRRKVNGKVNYVSALVEVDEGGNEDKALIVPSLFPNYIEEDYIDSIHKPIHSHNHSGVKDNLNFDFYVPPIYNDKPKDDNNNNNNNKPKNPLFF